MLTEKEKKQIREELICTRPLYLFDDDPDGLCSFLLLYKYVREGKGVIVKSKPVIGKGFVRKVDEYQPDKVIILDVPMIDDEFLDNVKIPILWIDHHEVQDTKVKYYNTRKNNSTLPTSYACWQVVDENDWIAMVGCVGDWHLPKDLKKRFRDKYPDLLDDVDKPEDALFNSKLGELVKIISFNLKGKSEEIKKSIKILTRINDPYEILEQKTPQGKYIYKKYEKINKEYEALKSRALRNTDDEFLIFEYSGDRLSLTQDLSNELMFMFPEKVIIIAREKNEEMKCSLRSEKYVLSEALGKAICNVEGYGGGHEHACGACIKKRDFERFIENLREEIQNIYK